MLNLIVFSGKLLIGIHSHTQTFLGRMITFNINFDA